MNGWLLAVAIFFSLDSPGPGFMKLEILLGQCMCAVSVHVPDSLFIG